MCPADKPIILYRDEFMQKLLNKLGDSEMQCLITDQLEVIVGDRNDKDNKANKVLYITENDIISKDEFDQ